MVKFKVRLKIERNQHKYKVELYPAEGYNNPRVDLNQIKNEWTKFISYL